MTSVSDGERQVQYLISLLQQQRNQALDAVADLAAQLNVAHEQLSAARTEIDRLRSSEPTPAA
jgi:uncharacterized protein involved in exopolysaccharide biosynthesis